MRKLIFAALAACLSFSALANPGPCIVNWPWQIPASQERTTQYIHKSEHAVGSALVTMAVAKATNSVEWGVAAGLTVGAVREFYKIRSPGMACEWSSMAFDAAGVALGAYAVHRWLVLPQPGGIVAAYSVRF